MVKKKNFDNGANDKPRFTRWQTEHTKALGRLFENEQADPRKLDTAHIDQIWEEVAEEEDNSIFNGITKEKFRSHYREKAAAWLTEQAMK